MDGSPAARACVVGASGFAGALAAQLLWNHPKVALEAITARSEVGRSLDDVYPRYRVPLTLEDFDIARLSGLDVAFVSYPHAAAAETVAQLRAQGTRVVDLSADFRLRDLATYERWYGPHAAPELLADAVFGLTELRRQAIASCDLIANPGCYSTAAILALAPLARAGLIATVSIDGKSGASGAGRQTSEDTHFVSVTENVSPYAVTGHRHGPEIDQELAALGYSGAATFVPHLLPIDQGLLTSCYVTPTRDLGSDELRELYADMYESEQFVELAGRPPGVREVRETNICRVHVDVTTDGRVVAFGALDNLWKGASGQAIQNMNVMLGLEEGTGL
ncbi:MAG: N-acetyl-gamma-glutamyl-phosphate reductase [Solirubrobacterales bacterium]